MKNYQKLTTLTLLTSLCLLGACGKKEETTSTTTNASKSSQTTTHTKKKEIATMYCPQKVGQIIIERI